MHPDVPDRPSAPDGVHRVAYAFFEDVARLLGGRLGESRFDPDRGLRVTVIDLTDDDLLAIRQAAEAADIGEWVRVEAADPDDLATWERLRHDLIRLSAAGGTLQSHPTPDPGYRRPPVDITLFAHAQSAADDLHATYGDFVRLQVGALAYPPSRTTEPVEAPTEARASTDPREMTLELSGPLSVASGHHVTHTVVLGNHGDRDITVETNGVITADVVDDDGTVVGGYVGPQRLPLVRFTAPPGGAVAIPLLVGTASRTPTLGYAIPPGTWRLTAPLDLADGRRLTSPPLTFTVTN